MHRIGVFLSGQQAHRGRRSPFVQLTSCQRKSFPLTATQFSARPLSGSCLPEGVRPQFCHTGALPLNSSTKTPSTSSSIKEVQIKSEIRIPRMKRNLFQVFESSNTLSTDAVPIENNNLNMANISENKQMMNHSLNARLRKCGILKRQCHSNRIFFYLFTG